MIAAVLAMVQDEKEVVAYDVAEQEFERFVDAMDLDVDKKGMSDDDRKSFEEQKRKVVRAIVTGKLAVDAEGQPVFTPSEGEKITFYEPRGKSIVAMDMRKAGQDIRRLFTAMADYTRQPEAVFQNMRQRDLRVCIAITNLFLG